MLFIAIATDKFVSSTEPIPAAGGSDEIDDRVTQADSRAKKKKKKN